MKRIFLFIATNLAVVLVLSVVTRLLGLDRFVSANGLQLGTLMGYSLVVGFTGSIISLLMSKPMAKWSTGAQVITTPQNQDESWLLQVVGRHAQRAGIAMPEVAIYDGEPNAFATGAFKNEALVAVSTGLLQGMTHEEIEAVLAHEVAHIANGDMVTMTLLQGVINTFVIFISRVIGFFIDNAMRKGDDRGGSGMASFAIQMVLQLVLGFLGSMVVAWFSRQREFRADAGSAQIMGRREPMIHALQRLGGLSAGELPKSVAAMGITGGLGSLFASHPPIEERVAALQSMS